MTFRERIKLPQNIGEGAALEIAQRLVPRLAEEFAGNIEIIEPPVWKGSCGTAKFKITHGDTVLEAAPTVTITTGEITFEADLPAKICWGMGGKIRTALQEQVKQRFAVPQP